MGKNTEIKFVGQPIFKQILGLLDIIDLKSIIKRNESDKYYKVYSSRTQLVTMLFGILSRCDSMGEICDGMRAMSGKLNHLGLSQSPAKSTACDGLRNRTDKFFEDVYFSLVKAYNYYYQFAQWTANGVYFVTRQKSNAVYTVIKTVRESEPERNKAMVTLEEFIDLEYKLEDDKGKKLKGPKEVVTLRRVCYQDEENRKYEFLTNNLKITAEEVAFLYKKRWGIELLFKKMKQNFQLHYFYGENETAIRTQVWCTLIAQLLMTVLQKKAATGKAFSIIATLVRIHLISMLDVYELLQSTNRRFERSQKAPPRVGQLAFDWA